MYIDFYIIILIVDFFTIEELRQKTEYIRNMEARKAYIS